MSSSPSISTGVSRAAAAGAISHTAAGRLSSPFAQKSLLLGASLAVISGVANSLSIVPFLLSVTIGSYLLLDQLDRRLRSQRSREVALYGVTTLFIAAFCTAEFFGIVGTLTGDVESLLSQSILTLGLPFYFLLITGTYADVLLERLPTPTFLNYSLLLLYFPKFLSGPIEAPKSFLSQIEGYRFKYDASRINEAVTWITLGLLFKFCVSNGLERWVYRYEAQSPIVILVSATAMELRLYFDLSGYSFIAFGLSQLFGIDLTLNFRHPLWSKNVREFWRAWHISLGRWYHTYVFAPLRERSHNLFLTKVCLPITVFIASALWHGITFNFLVWGLFHGLVFVLFITILHRVAWPRVIGIFALWAFLIFGRLLFMDANTERLQTKISTLFSWAAWKTDIFHTSEWLMVLSVTTGKAFVVILALTIVALEAASLRLYPGKPYGLFRSRIGFALSLLTLVLLVHGGQQGFIYARQ